MSRRRCTAIVLAAGRGKRMGGEVPKQFLTLGGRPLLYYPLAVFQNSKLVDAVIIVTGQGSLDYVREEIAERYAFDKVTDIIAGGAERYDSVMRGLEALMCMPEEYGSGTVLIHDGVRPFVDEAVIERAVDAVEAFHACAVGMPSKDTVKYADKAGFVEMTPMRERVWSIQTPQGFDAALVYEAYRRFFESGEPGATDDAMMVERFTDTRVKLVEGSYRNIKITTPEDLEAAEVFLKKEK